MTTANNLLTQGADSLRPHVPDPTLEARVLLADVLQVEPAALLTHPELSVTPTQEHDFRNALTKRCLGVPFAYVRGKQAFFGHNFSVGEGVLIPRPATELLVQTILHRFPDAALSFVDVGSGSGCIACSLLLARPTWRGLAIDPSPIARDYTQKNAIRLGVADRLTVREGFLLRGISPTPELIIANLPYLRSDQLTEPSITAEPILALDGGADGFLLINQLLEQVSQRPHPRGLVLECDPSQVEDLSVRCRRLFSAARVTPITETPTPVGVGVWWEN